MLSTNFVDPVIIDWGSGTFFVQSMYTGVRFFHFFQRIIWYHGNFWCNFLSLQLGLPHSYFVSSIQRKLLSIARVFDSVIAVDNLINHPMKGKTNKKFWGLYLCWEWLLPCFIPEVHAIYQNTRAEFEWIKNNDEEWEMVCKRRCSGDLRLSLRNEKSFSSNFWTIIYIFGSLCPSHTSILEWFPLIDTR